MNYSAFSIVILGLIIGYIFYDELYNKNVENVKNKENLSPLEIVLIILAFILFCFWLYKLLYR